MGRVVIYVVLPLVAAAVSAFNLVAFWLENMMNPRLPDEVTIAFVAAYALVFVFVAIAIAGLRHRRLWLLVVALVVVLAAGFLPRAVNSYVAEQAAQRQQADDAESEMRFQSALLDFSDDVDDRIAAHKPFTGDEAMKLVEFAAGADLSYRGLMDHTPEAYDLVRQAIEGGVLDPNARTSGGRSVTLAFYDKTVAPTLRAVRVHDWEVLQILVTGGADVGQPEAAGLKAALGKTAVKDASGRFLSLQ
jgi:hypothetical protein